MKKLIYKSIFLLIFLEPLMSSSVAVVLYDEGREFIDGITLLRDKDDSTAYYYLPTSPSVIIDPQTNRPKISLVRFEEPGGGTSGGLVHFLFGLDLPPERVESLNKELAKKVSGATIRGPVILRAEGDEEAGGASFKLISSTISNVGGKDSFTSSLVTSGIAPITPGSQAAVAARLNKHGTTLLWESLLQPTSDISISISASYEAALPSFRGTVSADLNTVYDHLYKIKNVQDGYKKKELRNQMDELVRTGVIKVDITDRSGLGVSTSKLSGIMNLVTDKLVSMLFDTKQGFSKLPEREKISKKDVKGRQKKGFLSKLFTGTGNQKYTSDDQFVIRKRKDIKRATFSMLFTQNTTIKVPFNTAGNIGGIYDEWKDDNSIFRLVTLGDAFNKQEIYVNLDLGFYESFLKYINSVSISFVKKYPSNLNQRDFNHQISFSYDEIKKGVLSKSFIYPGLGAQGEDLTNYGYRVLWSLRGGKSVAIPQDISALQNENTRTLTLSPPTELTNIEIFSDSLSMKDAEIRRATVNIIYQLLGENKRENITILPENASAEKTISLLHDKDSKIKYRITWYEKHGKTKEDWKLFEGDQIDILPTIKSKSNAVNDE